MIFLSDYFQKIAYKKLSAVEVGGSSNQHEFNGIGNLKEIFGSGRTQIEVLQIYLDDNSEDPLFAKSELTWYDSRENHPTRTEYRLYYKSTVVTEKFREGDLMIIARRPNGQFLNIFAQRNSIAEIQLKMLFRITEVTNTIENQTIERDFGMDFIRNFILEKLGVLDDDSQRENDDFLTEMLKRFPHGLPTSKVFSAFARSTVETGSANPDSLIIDWWERETQLFKLYERHQFESIKEKNLDDIDSFIKLSLSIQNTRKSRAGSALENHMEQIFIDNQVPYSRTPVTENNSKPDFIFPGIEEYRNPQFSAEALHMLAVKTSCKDRWRQVLPEALRISHKHLLTLEPAISLNQTEEMKSHNLTLVLPQAIHSSYSDAQRTELLTISEFVEMVGDRA